MRRTRKCRQLSRLYHQNSHQDSAKLKLLAKLSFNEIRDLSKALPYAQELISLSEGLGNNFLRAGYLLKGTKKEQLGELNEALESFLKSAEIAQATDNLIAEGESYVAIADVYSGANNHPNAKYYYKKAITTLRQSNDSVKLASALINAGDELRKKRQNDSALMYFNESKLIVEKIDYVSGRGYSLGGLGMVYATFGKNDLAEKNMNEAIRILEETGDYAPICDYFILLWLMCMRTEGRIKPL